jgi:capsular polysaccharide biosynthesis protein
MMPSERTVTDPSVREQLAGTFAFLRRAVRFWRMLLLTTLLGGIAFGVFSYLRHAKYRSETVILYVEKGDTEQERESSDAQRSVTVRLKELLYARPNLERVVARFGLYPEIRSSYGMSDAIEELKKHADFRAPGGDTFSIAFEGSSAREAQAVTAELGRLVIAGDAELRKSQAKVALDFLVGERQARDAELRAAEEELAAFMAQHPRFALDATPLANGAAIRASMGAAQAVGVGAGRPYFVAPRATPGSGAMPANPGAAAATVTMGKAPDPEEARARAALAAARESLTEKLAHYTPAHPDVRAAEGEVQRATERLAAITGGAPAAAPVPKPAAESTPAPPTSATTARVAAAPAAAPRPVMLAPTPAASAGGSQALVDLETNWLKLTRAVSEARQRLDQIEAQLFRADIQASTESGGHAVQVTVIDPAFLPQRPLPPGQLTLALIFLAASLVLGAVLALVRAVFDERLFSARDAASVTEVLVEVPRMSGRKAYVAS